MGTVSELRVDQRLPMLSGQLVCDGLHVLQQPLKSLLQSRRRLPHLRDLSRYSGFFRLFQSLSSGSGSRAVAS